MILPPTNEWYEEADLVGVPEPPDWLQKIGKLPQLPRAIRLCCPCIGINNGGRALKLMGVEYRLVNSCDLLGHLDQCLGALEDGASLQGVRLGKTHGDIFNVELSELKKPVDVLLAGPPCPPFASNGKREPWSDPRTDVFYQVLKWVIALVKGGGLLYCVLENVMGCTQKLRGGSESFMDIATEQLRTYCPEFEWRLDVLDAKDYLLAQSRQRAFLQGVRDLEEPREVKGPLLEIGQFQPAPFLV